MPRFYFHVQLGATYADHEGALASDHRRARDLALEIASQLVRDAADDLWRGDVLRVLAEDESRTPVLAITVTLDRPSGGVSMPGGARGPVAAEFV